MNNNNHSQSQQYLTGIGAGLALVVIIASVLRFYQLDSQMWLDEFSALHSIRRSWFEIVSVWPGASSHVLYEVLASWSLSLLGESAFSVRLPAAIFGIAGVAILGRLCMRIYTVKSGLFIAALMAVSYNHIFFSQNARGYTALIFFFLWSSYLFLRIVESRRMEWRTGLAYCLVTVLTCYCQPFGVFIPASHFMIAMALVILHDRNEVTERFPIKEFTYWMVAVGFVTLLLYVPFVDGMLAHAKVNVETSASGPRFNVGLLIEIVEGLSAAFFGYMGLAIAAIAGAVGVVIWYRCHPVSLFVLSLPIIIQAITFLIMGVGIHPRYFAIAIPVIYVAGGITFFYISNAVLSRIISGATTRQLIHSVMLGIVVIVAAYPLIRYYSVPKQDFQGALHFVEQLAKPDDIKVGIQTVGTIMTENYGSSFVRVDKLEQLLDLERSGKRLWIVMTLERIMAAADPALVNHIKGKYKLLKRLPGTVGDGSMQIYGQPD